MAICTIGVIPLCTSLESVYNVNAFATDTASCNYTSYYKSVDALCVGTCSYNSECDLFYVCVQLCVA